MHQPRYRGLKAWKIQEIPLRVFPQTDPSSYRDGQEGAFPAGAANRDQCWGGRFGDRRKIQDNDTYAFGFDAQAGKLENLVSHGIIDPTKVLRTALQNAASIAGLLITTEAMVAEVPKKQPPAPPMPGGGMDY